MIYNPSLHPAARAHRSALRFHVPALPHGGPAPRGTPEVPCSVASRITDSDRCVINTSVSTANKHCYAANLTNESRCPKAGAAHGLREAFGLFEETLAALSAALPADRLGPQ